MRTACGTCRCIDNDKPLSVCCASAESLRGCAVDRREIDRVGSVLVDGEVDAGVVRRPGDLAGELLQLARPSRRLAPPLLSIRYSATGGW